MLRDKVGVLAEPVARSLDLDDDGVVEQPVEQRGGDDWIPKHLRMHQVSIDELLTSRSQTRVIPCTDSGLNWLRQHRRAAQTG